MRWYVLIYEYDFDRKRCWYKASCELFEGELCTMGCVRFMEMDFMMAHSGIPRGAQLPARLTPERSDRPAFQRLDEIKENIVEYVEEGNHLYLYSRHSGNGKTAWVLKLMLRYFDEKWAGNGFTPRGVFLHAPSLLTRIKAAFNRPDEELEMLRENIADVDLVIWDDIAATRLSEYDHTILLPYIDQRCLAQKSNMYTGNFDNGEDVYHAIGQRLTSRVWNSSELIGFRGNRDGRRPE